MQTLVDSLRGYLDFVFLDFILFYFVKLNATAKKIMLIFALDYYGKNINAVFSGYFLLFQEPNFLVRAASEAKGGRNTQQIQLREQFKVNFL